MSQKKFKKKQTIQIARTLFESSLFQYAAFFVLSSITLLLLNWQVVYAGDLFGNADKLLNDIYLKFVGMSTAAAGVGVGTGTFMKKLSLGKQEKIELGNKVTKDSIIAWGTINGIGLVLNFLANYTT